MDTRGVSSEEIKALEAQKQAMQMKSKKKDNVVKDANDMKVNEQGLNEDE